MTVSTYRLQTVGGKILSTKDQSPVVPAILMVGVNVLARLAGFEPATHGLEVRCSVQLSYRRSEFAGLVFEW